MEFHTFGDNGINPELETVANVDERVERSADGPHEHFAVAAEEEPLEDGDDAAASACI